MFQIILMLLVERLGISIPTIHPYCLGSADSYGAWINCIERGEYFTFWVQKSRPSDGGTIVVTILPDNRNARSYTMNFPMCGVLEETDLLEVAVQKYFDGYFKNFPKKEN